MVTGALGCILSEYDKIFFGFQVSVEGYIVLWVLLFCPLVYVLRFF